MKKASDQVSLLFLHTHGQVSIRTGFGLVTCGIIKGLV